MSDNYIRLIPTDPAYVADSTMVERAREYLATVVPETAQVTARITNDVAFVDQGANFERVSCPNCGRELDVSWWQDAMDTAYETNFANLDITTPCCGALTSLNDLHYDLPAGFARLVLEVMNPSVSDITAADIATLSSMLGTALRPIWAHY